MKSIPLSAVTASHHATLKQVIRVIDHVGLRIAYIVNEKKELIGVITDSEIRQALLRGADPKSQIHEIINRTPIVLSETEYKKPFQAKKIARELLRIMPDSGYIMIIDGKRRLKRLIPLSDIIGTEAVYKKNNKRRTRHILVVGGAGYLGSILVRKLLLHNYRVRVLDSLMYGMASIEPLLRNNNFDFMKGDLRNISDIENALDTIDVVVNLAAIVGDPACKNHPKATIGTNYLANKALADACKYHQINRFLFASTCSVYGQMNGKQTLDENALLNPVSLYARSKIQSEEGILNLEDENFSPSILRLSTLYGLSPRMRFDLVVNTMVKNAHTNNAITVRNGGKQWRPLLHVADAAAAFIACIDAPIEKVKGRIFNVGSEKQNVTIIEIAQLVKKHFPSIDINVEKSNEDPRNYSVSFKKIQSVLNYKTKKTINDGIVEIQAMLQKGKITDTENRIYYNEQST